MPFSLTASANETVDSGPVHVWIESTTRCNTRCLHCLHYYENFGEDMPNDLFDKIMDSALKDVKSLELNGYGEPLIAAHFGRILDECISRNIKVRFTTNGIALQDDELLARLVRLPILITLSIDGVRPETYEFFRPQMKWEKAQALLDNIKKLREHAGEASSCFSISFNTVVARNTIPDLLNVIELAHRYGADSVHLLPLGGSDNYPAVHGQSLNDDPEILVGPLREAIRLAEKFGIFLGIPDFYRQIVMNWPKGRKPIAFARRSLYRLERSFIHLRKHGLLNTLQYSCSRLKPRSKVQYRNCTFPWADSFLSARGDVLPCCAVAVGGSMGNLHNETWEEIWNGASYRNLRRTVHSWNPTSICRHCCFTMGINGGDEGNYARFFSRFNETEISLDSPEVTFGEGFSKVEYLENGKPSHCWMAKEGSLGLARPRKAKYLRFHIMARSPVPEINPGRCRINGGAWESFDNSCMEITFPLRHVKGKNLKVEFEMENAWRPPNDDPRELGLAIHGISFMHP